MPCILDRQVGIDNIRALVERSRGVDRRGGDGNIGRLIKVRAAGCLLRAAQRPSHAGSALEEIGGGELIDVVAGGNGNMGKEVTGRVAGFDRRAIVAWNIGRTSTAD